MKDAPRSLPAVALLALLAACGSVTALHTDGGGTGGTHADASTKLDVAADRRGEDAHRDVPATRDASPSRDMAVAADARPTDARPGDASAHGGTGGGGMGGGGMSGGGMSGGGMSGGGMSGGGMSGGGMSGGGAGGGTAGECQSNGDCVLYAKLGSGCCGVCQPKTDPQPPPVSCLIACLTPLVTCGCVNQQCVGSTKQL